MDTSKLYIKMCDCPEIQGESVTPPNPNDYYARTARAFRTIRYGYQITTPDIIDDDYIWIPRQGQIQEMCGTYHDDKNGRWFCWVCTMERFNRFLAEFINREFEHEIECFDKPKEFKMASMEQLWLAFHMHEEHGKIWLNGKWANQLQ